MTSKDGRGTNGYRAPELLEGHYTNKVDIWGLGCILFEIDTKRKTFSSDYEVFQYAHASSSSSVAPISACCDASVAEIVELLLHKEALQRPLAAAAHKIFAKRLWQCIGDKLNANGELDESLKAYNKGLEADPMSVTLRTKLDDAYGFQNAIALRETRTEERDEGSTHSPSSSGDHLPHWTLRAGESDVSHQGRLGTGGSGEVHKVSPQ